MNYLKKTTDRLPKVPFTVKVTNDQGQIHSGKYFTATQKRMDPISGECKVRFMELDAELSWDSKKMFAMVGQFSVN